MNQEKLRQKREEKRIKRNRKLNARLRTFGTKEASKISILATEKRRREKIIKPKKKVPAQPQKTILPDDYKIKDIKLNIFKRFYIYLKTKFKKVN